MSPGSASHGSAGFPAFLSQSPPAPAFAMGEASCNCTPDDQRGSGPCLESYGPGSDDLEDYQTSGDSGSAQHRPYYSKCSSLQPFYASEYNASHYLSSFTSSVISTSLKEGEGRYASVEHINTYRSSHSHGRIVRRHTDGGRNNASLRFPIPS